MGKSASVTEVLENAHGGLEKHYFAPGPLIPLIVSLSHPAQSLLHNLAPKVALQLEKSARDAMASLSCCGASPSTPCLRQQRVRRVNSSHIPPQEVVFPAGLSPRECTQRLLFADFCARLLCPDPTLRMTAGEALFHPFLNLPELRSALAVPASESSPPSDSPKGVVEEDSWIRRRRLAALSSSLTASLRAHNTHHSHHHTQTPLTPHLPSPSNANQHVRIHGSGGLGLSFSTTNSPVLSAAAEPFEPTGLPELSLGGDIMRRGEGSTGRGAGNYSSLQQQQHSPGSPRGGSAHPLFQLPILPHNPLQTNNLARMRSQTLSDPLLHSGTWLGESAGLPSFSSLEPQVYPPPTQVQQLQPPLLGGGGVSPRALSHPLAFNQSAPSPLITGFSLSGGGQGVGSLGASSFIPPLSVDTGETVSSSHSSRHPTANSSQQSSPTHNSPRMGGVIAGAFHETMIPFTLPLSAFSLAPSAALQSVGSATSSQLHYMSPPSYLTHSQASSPPQSPVSSVTSSTFGPRSRGSSLAGGALSLYTSSSGYAGSFSSGSTPPLGPLAHPPLQHLPRLWPASNGPQQQQGGEDLP